MYMYMYMYILGICVCLSLSLYIYIYIYIEGGDCKDLKREPRRSPAGTPPGVRLAAIVIVIVKWVLWGSSWGRGFRFHWALSGGVRNSGRAGMFVATAFGTAVRYSRA